MKEITSTCELNFVKKIISANKRLDGRDLTQSRQIDLTFGTERGCVLVSLGNTCVLAQVSCELAAPRAARSNEGQLHLNVDLSPMAAPNIEVNRSSDIGIAQSRLLERCVRDSRCIDLESLCIVSGEKVWNIRVDVHVLNHDGNLSECTSVAAVAALSHFRRPDVTVLGTDVTVHTAEERDPIPLNLLHMPFSTTIAVFDNGESLVIDPTEIEDRVSEGQVVIAMNTHQELCMLHMGGNARISKETVMTCTAMASIRIQQICIIVKTALALDSSARAAGLKIGFAEKLVKDKILGTKYVSKNMLESLVERSELKEKDKKIDTKPASTFLQEPGAILLGEGGPSQWDMLDMDIEIQTIKQEILTTEAEQSKAAQDAGESSEEETMVLGEETEEKSKKKSQNKGISKQFMKKN